MLDDIYTTVEIWYWSDDHTTSARSRLLTRYH